MTRDEVIRLAGEVGIEFDPRWGSCYTGNVQLERFAAMVAAAEREACLKMLDDNWYKTQSDVATAIRARGET
jgi:hypothetical protein